MISSCKKSNIQILTLLILKFQNLLQFHYKFNLSQILQKKKYFDRLVYQYWKAFALTLDGHIMRSFKPYLYQEVAFFYNIQNETFLIFSSYSNFIFR